MRKLCCIVLICLLLTTPLVTYAQENFYPADVFHSMEQCSQYFERCSQNTFEEVDGEMVMTVPFHQAIDWMYSKAPVDYDTYTIAFDFALRADNGSEANLLFAMAGDGGAFHQISFVNSGGNLYLVHYEFTGAEWITYSDDHMMFASYEGDTWCSAIVEFMPDEINIYIDGEYALTLMETPDYFNGHIGLRCGSAGGFKIKNFTLTEGIGETATETPTEEPAVELTEEPTEEPTVEVTEEPTEEPTVEVTEAPTQVATQAPTQKPSLQEEEDSSSLVLWFAIAGIVVVGTVLVAAILLKKRKR